MSQYDSLIQSAAQQNNVDPYILKGLLMSESSLNPSAVSHDAKGNPIASGIAQFTPGTAKAMGVNNPLDPSQAIPGAARLLRQNLDASQGDTQQAIAMYKGGTDQSQWGPVTTSGTLKAMRYADQYRAQAASSNDPVLSFMNQHGQSAPAQSSNPAHATDPVLSFMNGQHPASAPNQQTQQPPEPNNPFSGGLVNQVENAMSAGATHALAGVAGSIAGLGSGIKTLFTSGGDFGQANAARDAESQSVSNSIDSLNPSETTTGGKIGAGIVNAAGSVVGGVVNGLSSGAGALAQSFGTSPQTAQKLSSIVNFGANAGLTVMGTKAMLKGAPAPAEGDTVVEPASVSAPAESENSSLVAGGDRASAGAAGTSYAAQAEAQGVPASIVQRISQAEQSGAFNDTAAVRHIEAGSLPVPVDLTAGQATGDPGLISWEQNMRGKVPELSQRFNDQSGQVAGNLDAIREQVAPDINVPPGVALDQSLVDAYKNMDAPIRAAITQKYQALRDANGGDMPVNGSDFVAAADSALKADNKAYFVPSQVQSLMDDYRQGGQMSFNDFESLRTILANEARKADRAGDGNAAHAVGIVRDSLESLPMSDEAANIKPLADDARAAARARFQSIAADPAYKDAVNDGIPPGESSPVADGFVQKYVASGKTANVQNMMQNLSNDPINAQLVAAGLVDHLKKQAGIDPVTGAGNVSQARLNKAIRQLDQKSSIVLGGNTAQTLDTLGNVARYTQEQPRGSFVNNSNTFVAGAAHLASGAIEGIVNMKAGGIPVGSWARNAIAKRSLGKAVGNSLDPGAGVKMSNLVSKKRP